MVYISSKQSFLKNKEERRKKKKQKQKSRKEKKIITWLKKFIASLNLSSSSHPKFVARQSSWIRDPTTKGSKSGPLVTR